MLTANKPEQENEPTNESNGVLYGEQAIIAAGFPLTLINKIINVSKKLQQCSFANVALALRVGQPPNVEKGFAISFKPMSMKTKTSSFENESFVSGFIPYDQETFGRPGSSAIPEKIYQPVQLHISLREVLAGIEAGNYSLISFDKDTLQFSQKLHDKLVVSYKLTFNNSKEAIPHHQITKEILTPWHKPMNVNLSPEQSDHEEKLDTLFPIFYKSEKQTEFLPLNVAATLDGHPVTGDADLLWIAMSSQMTTSQIQHDTSTPNGLSNLITEYLALRKMYKAQKNEKDEPISQATLNFINTLAEKSGLITAFEFFLISKINKKFNKKFYYLQNILQHGPETNNPSDKPSPLNGGILHFYNNNIVYTSNEDELIQFVLQEDFLKSFSFPVHHKWDMKKWAPVVKKQLELNYFVSEKTKAAYQQTIDESLTNLSPVTFRYKKDDQNNVQKVLNNSRENYRKVKTFFSSPKNDAFFSGEEATSNDNFFPKIKKRNQTSPETKNQPPKKTARTNENADVSTLKQSTSNNAPVNDNSDYQDNGAPPKNN